MKRRPVWIAATLWITAIQYFIVEQLVARHWAYGFPFAYSYRTNFISDLGKTDCDPVRMLCSPWHALMNISFIWLGLQTLIGGWLLRDYLRSRGGGVIGITMVAVSGIGTIVVGFFPENTVSVIHIAGAAGPFVLGNIGMVVTGMELSRARVSPILAAFTRWSGVVGLIGLVLYGTHSYLDIGIGGMERVIAYPLTIWMIVTGVYLMARHKQTA